MGRECRAKKETIETKLKKISIIEVNFNAATRVQNSMARTL